jgi:hypothetical protein
VDAKLADVREEATVKVVEVVAVTSIDYFKFVAT